MREKDEVALALLSTEINKRQDELISLEDTFRRLGGTFDGDEQTERPAKQKLLPAPNKKKQRRKKSKKVKSAEPDEFGVTINGLFIKLKERQAAVVELMQSADHNLLSKDAIAECWGTTPNWVSMPKALNNKLAAAGVAIVAVHGKGFQLQPVK